MKRLVPAAIVLIFTICICFVSFICVEKSCSKTLQDIENFYNNNITDTELKEHWQNRKEIMSLFVNHSFLDKITIYISQLTVIPDSNITEINAIRQSIEAILSIIKDEQKLTAHSFY